MKLIECRVENFGRLHQQSFTFSEGLTTILEENGFGKSTLAAFIKAMFYGMPANKTRKTLAERKRYMPWNGGRCGGSLSFAYRGGRYKIERFFGAKESEDTLTVYDLATNRETAVFGGEIGRTVFGVDSDSYERTAYLPQKEVAHGMTDSINAKLNNLIDNTDDINNYDSAFAALEKRRKYYEADRGGGGKLHEWQSRLSEVELYIVRYAEKAEEAARRQQALNADAVRLQALRERERTLREQRERFLQFERQREYRREAAQAEQALAERQTFFRQGMPTAQTLEEHRAAVESLGRKRAERRGLQLPEEAQAQFARLAARKLTDEDAAQVEQAQADWQRCREEAAAYAALVDTDDWARQQTRFAAGVPEDEAIDACIASLEAAARPAADSTEQVTGKGLLWMLPAALVLAAGIVCLVLALTVVGILLTAVGGVGLVVAAAAHLLGRQKAAQRRAAQTAEAQRRYQAAQTAAQQLLAAYGYGANSPLTALSELKRAAGDYRRMVQLVRQSDEAQNRCRLAEERLTALLHAHGLDSVEQLRREREQYAALRSPIRQMEEQRTVLDEQITALERKLAAFFAAFALDTVEGEAQKWEVLRENCRQQQEASARLAQAQEKLQNLLEQEPALAIEEHEIPTDAAVITGEWEAVRAEIETLDRQITAEQNRIDRLTEEGDQVTEYESEKLRLQEQLAEGQRQHTLLKKTIKLLEQAKENLSTRYLDPVLTRFVGYAAEFAPELRNAAIDTELEVMVESEGERRKRDYFSEGYQGIYDICLRLALVEAMYPEDAPCLILDDPFVNLDDNKLTQALAILQRLSDSVQILYLSCHSSRVPK